MPDMQLADRIVAVLDDLGIGKAHIATQLPGDIADLVQHHRSRVAGVALVAPSRCNPARFRHLGGNLLYIAPEGGTLSKTAARSIPQLPDAKIERLPGCAAESWDDIASERPDLTDILDGFLGPLGSADTGTRIRRLRKLSGTPIALEEIWLDASVGTLEPEMIGEALYQTYRSELGVWITHAEDRVAIAPLPEWARDVPGFSDTSPTGFIERYSWQDASVPIEFSRTWFDTETSVYVQRIA